MALQSICIYLFLLFYSLTFFQSTTSNNESQYLTLMKKSLSGNALSSWNTKAENSYCKYKGITCNVEGHVTGISMPGWSLKGSLPPDVCSYLPELRELDMSNNMIQGNFPDGILNCSHLQILNISSLNLGGKLPDFSQLQSLRVLDLSYNHFIGDFPTSITNLTNLEVINLNENNHLNPWKLPETITRLTKLKSMVFSTCMLQGRIPPFIGNMTSLVDLELSGNDLSGNIPAEIGNLKNLGSLMLYYNQRINGTIPEELGNLKQLVDLDISVNQLTGRIPDSLCRLPNLYSLQLYNNSLTGELPASLGDSNTLAILSLYDNNLTGEIPQNLGKSSSMILLDLSENQLSGKLPPYICNGGKLVYFLVLSNRLTEEIPESYAKCTSLLRFRVSNNDLEGSVPAGLLGIPHVSIIDIAYNQLSGSVSPEIGNALNMSEFFAQGNKLSGVLPPEICRARNLVKIDLSNNRLSGPIPTEIGNLKKLNLLLLQNNSFTSSIPDSLSQLKSLNDLDLSNNQLTGHVPHNLSKLLPNSINFSNNRLYGPIPLSLIKGGVEESFLGNKGLCITAYSNSSDRSFPLCPHAYNQKKLNRMWVGVASAMILLLAGILFLKRWLTKEKSTIGHDDSLALSFCSYDVKSFHEIRFEEREIIESMVDKNILGHGGSGTVYRIGLSNGEDVAVKKLWSQKKKQIFSDKELETEVETLGSIRHKNIVKLYCHLSSWDCSLLVYEYMPNGNLWDAIHKGKIVLDWPTRRQIALGIAQGLAYLHHDLLPPIVHRDIKSSNILLDADYQPKLADFGVAKVLQPQPDNDFSTTVVAGTYGYMDPDYAKTCKATTKCDVYSFGVVLMELVTGKKPVETEFGENKNIINWVSSKLETKEGALEILDKNVSGYFMDDMIQVIRIAIRCTARAPVPRPTMNQIVELLSQAHSSNSMNKHKDVSNPTNINKAFEP